MTGFSSVQNIAFPKHWLNNPVTLFLSYKPKTYKRNHAQKEVKNIPENKTLNEKHTSDELKNGDRVGEKFSMM